MPGNIQSIERAAAILRLLSGPSRRLGVVDLAGELELPKGTIHGLLTTLKKVGFVEQDEASGKYQLGPALLHMGSSYLDGNELRTRALNWADSLASRAQEGVRIGTLHDSQVLIVHHVFRPDNSYQTLEVGSLMPIHATAFGKVLLADHPYLIDELLSEELARYTDRTITDAARFREEIALAKERGWALCDGELVSHEATIAAPIVDRNGLTVGAMGIVGSSDRIVKAGRPKNELLSYVQEAARAVSRELGAIPW